MNRKTIIIGFAVLVLVGGLYVFTSKNVDAPTKEVVNRAVEASLVTNEDLYDFGTIDIFGGTVTTEFPITNTGEQAIVVLDGTTSCACTVAELSEVDIEMHKGMSGTVTIEPGETKILSVTYDPLFHGPNGTGKITREVILKTNSEITPEVRARFQADVVKG